MVDVNTAALLAGASYNESGFPTPPAGWDALAPSMQLDSGFTGNAFFNSSTNTLVIGYGGTNGQSDVVADAQLAVTGSSTQEAEAVSFATGVMYQFQQDVNSGLYTSDGPFNVVYVGHSLGGVLAQRAYLANNSGTQAIVFNSPGLGGFWGADGLQDNGINYYYSDPATWGEASGPGFFGSLVTAGNVHNLGDLLNDNVSFILSANGHGLDPIIVALTENGQIPLTAQQWGAILAEQLRTGVITPTDAINMAAGAQQVFRDVVYAAMRESGTGCFAAGTMISMFDGAAKPIEDIRKGDFVVSYTESGELVRGEVTGTKTHEVAHVLDVFGLKVTPGHVTYCADGAFKDTHVPLIDILRSDGALMREDGTLVRANTGCEIGSSADTFVEVVTMAGSAEQQVVEQSVRMRTGSRIILDTGHDVSLLDLIEVNGGWVNDDGLVVCDKHRDGRPFLWSFSQTLPKPEDYLLQRSGLTLAAIFAAGEWEGAAPRLPYSSGNHAKVSDQMAGVLQANLRVPTRQ